MTDWLSLKSTNIAKFLTYLLSIGGILVYQIFQFGRPRTVIHQFCTIIELIIRVYVLDIDEEYLN